MVDERLDGPARSGARGAPIDFFFNGRRMRAYPGETVGAALHAGGVRVLMRSIKYHRPRGLFCNQGKCGNCLLRVDGTPNVRACVTPVREGMRVRTQNGWPSARHDFLAVVDKVYRTSFDVHDKFTRPSFMRPFYNGVIRRMAGFGKAPDPPRVPVERPPIRRIAPDVLVAGGGASGLAAAVAAQRAGARVVVIEESPRLGGRLHYETGTLDAGIPFMGAGPEVAGTLADEILGARAAEPHLGATVVGAYLPKPAVEPVVVQGDGAGFTGSVAALTPLGLLEIRPRALVVATGANDTLIPFPANDLPGVLSAHAAQNLLLDHGVRPGRRAVVVGFTRQGFRVAEQLAAAGVDVAAHVPAGDEPPPGGIVIRPPARPGARIAGARGGLRVRAVVLEEAGAREKVACDLVVLAHDGAPRVELLQQTDCGLHYDEAARSLRPALDKDNRATAPGVFACGRAAGPKAVADAVTEGWRAGVAAAKSALQTKEAAG